MILFEGKVGGRFVALTRPRGEFHFHLCAGKPPMLAPPAINLAQSPDALHWKPLDRPFLVLKRGSLANMKLGGGSQQVLTPEGWLMIYHGVETREAVGIYRSFWALLDRDDLSKVLRLEDEVPLLEANAAPIADRLYLQHPAVFTTGIADADDPFISSPAARPTSPATSRASRRRQFDDR
ncbi:putative GH43/DUF377 family glycosyl hydrolase [Sphingomonas zeicaulis]|uniref:glycoside hydrolase family 130 protein n=1 Tax=Sphingomonas zeicaulis TaxID=1632740 RepID=UPI003D1F65C2